MVYFISNKQTLLQIGVLEPLLVAVRQVPLDLLGPQDLAQLDVPVQQVLLDLLDRLVWVIRDRLVEVILVRQGRVDRQARLVLLDLLDWVILDQQVRLEKLDRLDSVKRALLER
jgi:hypothetical protein